VPLTPAQKQKRYRARVKLRAAQTTARRSKPPKKGKAEAPAKAPPIPPLPTIDVTDAKAVTKATIEQLREQLHKLNYDPTASPRERVAVSTALTSALRFFARLTGELDISKSQIVRSQHWLEIMRVLEDALRPFPEAAHAVARALEGLAR